MYEVRKAELDARQLAADNAAVMNGLWEDIQNCSTVEHFEGLAAKLTTDSDLAYQLACKTTNFFVRTAAGALATLTSSG